MSRFFTRRSLAIAAAVFFFSAISRGDVVLDWNALMIDAIRVDNSGPTLSSRNLAILHTAIYDAVNSILRTHQPYQFQLAAPVGASAEAAAVGAAYKVVRTLYQPLSARADELYQAWLALVPTNESLTNGLALGGQIAQLMLQARAADGSSTDVPYIPSDAPGQWLRARAVMAYLVTKGLPASALTARGYGPDSPKVPNTTAANRATHRRVEIKRVS